MNLENFSIQNLENFIEVWTLKILDVVELQLSYYST